jgi:hypothetical protein
VKPEVIESVQINILHEMIKARNKHGPFASLHEAYAVILEELDELWEEVRKKREDRHLERVITEAIHVAATALRLACETQEKIDAREGGEEKA